MRFVPMRAPTQTEIGLIAAQSLIVVDTVVSAIAASSTSRGSGLSVLPPVMGLVGHDVLVLRAKRAAGTRSR